MTTLPTAAQPLHQDISRPGPTGNPPADALPPAPPLAARMAGLGSSAIRDLLAVTAQADVLSLAGGLPATDGFPTRDLRRRLNHRLRHDGAQLLQYGPTEGYGPLRHWIALDEGRRHDKPIPDSSVLITTGAQQAIDLVARVLLDPDATVVVEDPAYLGAVQAFSLYQPRILAVPVDGEGLCVESLARLLEAGERPAVVYTVSSFHNPSGVTLSGPRRRRLAELADRYRFWIVDDDPYHELRFAGAAPAPIGTWTDRVIRLGSFSKTVAPGLRVGWAVAPPELVEPMVRAKQAADLQASSLAQPVLADFVADEARYQAHLARLRGLYRARATALGDALEAHFGPHLEFRRPDGGMFIWARFTDGTDTRRLLTTALDHGVAFVPGAEFRPPSPTPPSSPGGPTPPSSPGGPGPVLSLAVVADPAGGPGAAAGSAGDDGAWLRLSFATCRPRHLAQAVDRLHRAWLAGGGAASGSDTREGRQ